MSNYDTLAQYVRRELPHHTCVAIIGSASFWDPESERTCREIGTILAELPDVVLITGGISGVGDTVGRSFYVATRARSGDSRVIHVLPDASPSRPYGLTFLAGEDMHDRREVLGRLAKVYIVVEGGPGTRHEANVACAHGATLVPVGRSGGVASELYQDMPCPAGVDYVDWAALMAESIHPALVARAVKTIISQLLVPPDIPR